MLSTPPTKSKALASAALAFLLSAGARAQASGPDFDGAGPGAALLPPPAAPRPPSAAFIEESASPAAIPEDLLAAAARVGVAAQLAKLDAAPAGSSFRFAVIGDAEPGRFAWERLFSPGAEVFERQMDLVRAEALDFALQLGDFVSEGSVLNYRAHALYLEALDRPPLLHCIGNHDRSRPNGDADKRLYDAVMGPRDYYFDRSGWRFIALDSSDRRLSPAQLGWLSKALDVPGRKVIFTHVPPAYLRKAKPLLEAAPERGTASVENPPQAEGYLRDFFTNYFEDGSDEFERLVSEKGVAAVYMGHIHAFWAGDHKGVRYVISGGGGSPLYPLPPGYPAERFAHYLTVEASPSGLVETVHPYGGAPFLLPPAER